MRKIYFYFIVLFLFSSINAFGRGDKGFGIGYNMGFLTTTNNHQALAGLFNTKYPTLTDPFSFSKPYRGFSAIYTIHSSNGGFEILYTNKELSDEAQGTTAAGVTYKSYISTRTNTFNFAFFAGNKNARLGASLDVGAYRVAIKTAEIAEYEKKELASDNSIHTAFTLFGQVKLLKAFAFRPYYQWSILTYVAGGSNPGGYLFRGNNFGLAVFLMIN